MAGTAGATQQALLTHYKERVENFEAERQELLDSIDMLKVQHEEQHRLRWEVRAREDEVRARNARKTRCAVVRQALAQLLHVPSADSSPQ